MIIYIIYTYYIALQLYYNDHDDDEMMMDFEYSANVSHRHDRTLSSGMFILYDSDKSVINNY